MKSSDPTEEKFISPFVASKTPQYVAALTATVGAFCSGTVFGWTSPGIPDMKDTEEFADISESDESLIASIATLGAAFAGFAAGFLIEKIGRKWTMFALAIPFVIGWSLMAFSNGLGMTIAGRFITGFGAGSYTLAVPVYNSEIVQSEIRGAMGNAMALILVTGIEFSYIVGALVSWKISSIICGIVPILFAVAITFMPESPYYLLDKGKKEEAGKALMWLRGAHKIEDIQPELDTIQQSLDERNAQSVTMRDLVQSDVLKPLSISMMLMAMQQLGGINAVLFNSTSIFVSAGTTIDANVCSIIIGGVQVVFCFVSTLLVDRVGRKILVLISAIGMAIGLAVLGVYFYLQNQNDGVTPDGLGWLPLVSLIGYIITYNLGLGPLPWLLMSELVPPKVKGLASAIATSFCWLLAFVVTFTFNDLRGAMYDHGCYWLFSGLTFGGAVYAFLVLPETKGKSLDEIQRLFAKK